MEVLQIIISGLSQGCVYGLIALGFVLIYKATEMVNFAQGDLMMLGAFLAYTFTSLLGMPFLFALAATLGAMALVGVCAERLLVRPMIGEPHFSVLMLTIGLGFILRALAGIIWGYEPKTLATPYAGKVINLDGLIIGYEDVVIIVINLDGLIIGYENVVIILGTALLCGLLFVFFRFSRLGIAMQAASQNQLAAFYVGIPVKRIYALVWAVSAVISAVAGILVAPVALIDPLMGFIGIKAFAAAIVGGFGSLPGALAGGLLIGLVEQFAGLYLPPGFSEVSAYAILLLMLMVRPEGIFATLAQKKV